MKKTLYLFCSLIKRSFKGFLLNFQRGWQDTGPSGSLVRVSAYPALSALVPQIPKLTIAPPKLHVLFPQESIFYLPFNSICNCPLIFDVKASFSLLI